MHDPSVTILDRPLGYGHGGARRGAGAKPGTYEKSDDLKDLDAAKARHENTKADLAELDLRTRRGELVERAGVQTAAATALATLAQALRSVPDALERELGISPEVGDRIGRMIDSALDDCANSFEMMSGPVTAADDVTDARVK